MRAPVPFHQVEAVILAELADGPRIIADLAEAVGRPEASGVVIVEAALRSMKARGLVRSGPGPDGVVRWRWAR